MFRKILVFLAPWLIASAAYAQFTIPGFELVETVPTETNLGMASTRDTTTVWCEMFDGARQEIALEQFYIADKPGETFDKVQACLMAAGKRGVKIRFLLDGSNKFSDLASVERVQQIPNLELRKLDFGKLQPQGIIHAKFVLVDRKVGFVGSPNYDWRAFAHIHETGLRITDDAVVSQMLAIFDHDWNAERALAAGKNVVPLNTAKVLGDDSKAAWLVASPNAFNPAGVGDSESELVRLLASAKSEVRVLLYDYSVTGYGPNNTRPYYDTIDRAVRAAAVRGVKIKLLLSATNADRYRQAYLKSLAMMPNVEIRLVTIPEALTGPIPYARLTHSKTMSIDGKVAWIGTSNWSGGYLDASRNLEIVLRNVEMAQRIAATHEQMWNSAYAQPLDINRDYAVPKR
jgi:phosphatidylserine/phosphatidylglycerophosphate/cardiolipin synthase-like enzyme